eukprot:CAMPEP_0194078318 /NCGR_PEP_ID=MMETSP0149-20130528/4744_1 /TAXON_ID=122233 /ORGANISM="Chaetoceros debilis, Strain MM31A-1" /LENGTH=71 /DNA_ID=CAMNT_0038759557 /DNA_START=189 /DNA_END=404 /DNA_ORIENTATION=-
MSSKLWLLPLGRLVDKRLVNMGNNSSTCNSCLNQGIELFISSDSELKMSGRNTLHLEILTGITREFEDFGG